MTRLLLVAFVAGAVTAAGLFLAFARSGTRPAAAPSEDAALTVQRSTLRPGSIVLLARNDGAEPVRLAQVMVDDAFVDFDAERLVVAPSRETKVTVHYPWIAGESYEIGLVTSTGAIVEYELETVGET